LVTLATFWCLVAALTGHWQAAVAGETIRLAAAAAAMAATGEKNYLRLVVVPFRDLFGFAVWCAGLLGDTVEWRGLRFHLRRDGRIDPI
jgi:hypothetical protein